MSEKKNKMITEKDFQAIFRELVVAFQPRGLERDTVGVYHRALKHLPIDVLRESAATLMRVKSFFPTTGEWHSAAMNLQQERRRSLAANSSTLNPIECEMCDDTGSVYADCPGDRTCGRGRPHAPHGFVCVCACRVTNETYQRRQASAAAGQVGTVTE